MSVTVLENKLATKVASASSPGKISVAQLSLIVLQLGLLTAVLYQFEIESAGFFRLAILAFAGFILHALLPMRLRLSFFLALSVVGIALVLGITNAVWLIAIGLVLIGLCHLPVSFRIRGCLLVVVGGILVAQRAGWLPSLWSNAVWPILGSIFMFRLAVYFYELRHETTPASLTQTLSYFFLLPNVCFPTVSIS